MFTADAEERSSGILDEMFGAEDECDDVYIDLDQFWEVMGAPDSPSQVVFHDFYGSLVSFYLNNWNF